MCFYEGILHGWSLYGIYPFYWKIHAVRNGNGIHQLLKGNGRRKNMLYVTYEEPLKGRTFTETQLREVYRDMADKAEYPDYEIWKSDMLKSGVFEVEEEPDPEEMETLEALEEAELREYAETLEAEGSE
jgi:hypothetical protein